jgi:hypothetical protein
MAGDRTTTNFDLAIPKFHRKLLNFPKARNMHYLNLEYKVTKDPFKECISHLCCWKEYFRILKKLPKGIKQDLSKDKLKLWYVCTFCKPLSIHYLASCNFNNDTLQDITKFMRLQQDHDRKSGKLKRLKSNIRKSDKDHNNHGSGKRVRIAVDNITKIMAANMRNLIAAAVPVAAMSGIVSTFALAIAICTLVGALARAKYVEGNSYVQTSAIVPNISLVSTPRRNVPKTPIARKRPRVTSKRAITILTQVRVSLVIAHVDPTPVTRKKFTARTLVRKKEKSL